MKISIRKLLVLVLFSSLTLSVCFSSEDNEGSPKSPEKGIHTIKKTIVKTVKAESENQMAILDWFAGQALEAEMSTNQGIHSWGSRYEFLAKRTFDIANAMMEERKKYLEMYGSKSSKAK